MFVNIIYEYGYFAAAYGARLSRESQDRMDSTVDQLGPDDLKLLTKLANRDRQAMGDPHSGALRMVDVWINIKMPLYWWKHMDTYAIGKDQSSASTMNNIMDRPLTPGDFTEAMTRTGLDRLNFYLRKGRFNDVIALLPSCYLQKRMVKVSLTTLARIISQRRGHKLPEWEFFIDKVMAQLRYPELINAYIRTKKST